MSVNLQTAFIFPGQGSQQVGMLVQHAEKYPIVRDTFAQASMALGYDLWDLVQQGPQDRLNLTENSQPALLAASVAIWRLIQVEKPMQPALLAGHSLGEWSALVCAGVVSFEDAVKLVQLRGRYMQEAVPVGQGTMAAIIGLDDDAIAQACERASEGEVVTAVNFNSPGQVVIAGHAGAVDRAMVICKEMGAKRALPLAVSAPFHTSLMQPAAERLAGHIENTVFHPPSVPVVHNVHAQVEADPQAIKTLMIKQIYAPVQWVGCVETLASKGITEVVECGPGKVLSGLVKRIVKPMSCVATDPLTALDEFFKEQN